MIEELLVGDVMIYRDAKSPISALIRWGTQSNYSHVARVLGDREFVLFVIEEMIVGLSQVIRENGGQIRFSAGKRKIRLEKIAERISGFDPKTVLIIESDFKNGVHISPLPEVQKRSGSHDIFRTQYPKNLSRKRFVIHAVTLAAAGSKYDYVGLLWQAVIAARMKFFKRKTKLIVEDISKFYCSEFSKYLDRSWGVGTLVENFEAIPPSQTTPQTEAERDDYYFEFNLPSSNF